MIFYKVKELLLLLFEKGGEGGILVIINILQQ
jgi:hypothetical protein